MDDFVFILLIYFILFLTVNAILAVLFNSTELKKKSIVSNIIELSYIAFIAIFFSFFVGGLVAGLLLSIVAILVYFFSIEVEMLKLLGYTLFTSYILSGVFFCIHNTREEIKSSRIYKKYIKKQHQSPSGPRVE